MQLVYFLYVTRRLAKTPSALRPLTGLCLLREIKRESWKLSTRQTKKIILFSHAQSSLLGHSELAEFIESDSILNVHRKLVICMAE